MDAFGYEHLKALVYSAISHAEGRFLGEISGFGDVIGY